MPGPISGVSMAAVAPAAPAAAFDADKANPGEMAALKAEQQRTKTGKYGSGPGLAPHRPPSAEDRREKKSWIEIVLQYRDGKPVPGEPYCIVLPDGVTAAEGTLDEKGFARVDGIDPGMCKVTFPRLEKQAWKPK